MLGNTHLQDEVTVIVLPNVRVTSRHTSLRKAVSSSSASVSRSGTQSCPFSTNQVPRITRCCACQSSPVYSHAADAKWTKMLVPVPLGVVLQQGCLRVHRSRPSVDPVLRAGLQLPGAPQHPYNLWAFVAMADATGSADGQWQKGAHLGPLAGRLEAQLQVHPPPGHLVTHDRDKTTTCKLIPTSGQWQGDWRRSSRSTSHKASGKG